MSYKISSIYIYVLAMCLLKIHLFEKYCSPLKKINGDRKNTYTSYMNFFNVYIEY